MHHWVVRALRIRLRNLNVMELLMKDNKLATILEQG